MIENLKEIEVSQLKHEVGQLLADKYRFVTCSSADNRDGSFDVYYHFDKDYDLANLKITVTQETVIPSISDFYFCAFLVENEISELYGLKIAGMALDYGGKMYLTADSDDCPMTYGANITIERRDIGYDE